MNAMQLVDRYLETWNETDADARRASVVSVWTEDGRYVDPMADVEGRDQISDHIGAVQQQIPGHVFRLLDGTGSVDAHHNLLRFSWELVPASGGEPVAIGSDVAITDGDGHIGTVLGFLDKTPAA
jgi:hypothetical protein